MAQYDLHSNIKAKVALDHTAVSSDGFVSGNTVDTKGFESLEFIVHVGTITGGTYTTILKEDEISSVSSSSPDVPTLEVLDEPLVFTVENSLSTMRVGSIGKKRFQKIIIDAVGVTGSSDFSATAILSNPHISPVPE